MFTKVELMDAINELLEGKNSIQNCAKLSAIYTVLDHLYPPNELMSGYSGDANYNSIGRYGNSEFLKSIAGHDQKDMWLLMDELMQSLSVVYPRLYDCVMRKISEGSF